MQARLNYYPQIPQAFEKLVDLGKVLETATLDKTIQELVKIRSSQINNCGFCVDMHIKEAKIHGERDLRLHHIAIWHESPLFTAKEKAALEWTEAVTKLSQNTISDELYARTREFFSEKEITELTLAIAIINAWNRFGATFKSVPGSLDKVYGLDKAGL